MLDHMFDLFSLNVTEEEIDPVILVLSQQRTILEDIDQI